MSVRCVTNADAGKRHVTSVGWIRCTMVNIKDMKEGGLYRVVSEKVIYMNDDKSHQFTVYMDDVLVYLGWREGNWKANPALLGSGTHHHVEAQFIIGDRARWIDVSRTAWDLQALPGDMNNTKFIISWLDEAKATPTSLDD